MSEPGTVLTIYHGHNERVSAVAWSPDTARIASGSWDKTVQVWDPALGTRCSRISTMLVAWKPWRGRPMAGISPPVLGIEQYTYGMLPRGVPSPNLLEITVLF